jgi:serine/threonine protein phosphatase PrpC
MQDLPNSTEPLRADQTLPTLHLSAFNDAPSTFDIAGRTDVGLKRERNEDQFVVARLGRAVQFDQTSVPGVTSDLRVLPQGLVLVVADGMGGHGYGDLASAVTVDALMAALPIPSIESSDAATSVQAALEHCQRRVQEVASRKGIAEFHIGTTLTFAYVHWPHVVVGHVGDSRCYLLRGQRLHRLTHDHTMGEALRAKGASDAIASRFDHALVNAVGGDDKPPAPELSAHQLEPGDRLLLCSDGLTAEVEDEQISAILTGATSSVQACESLIDAANRAGGSDNVTAVVAHFQ